MAGSLNEQFGRAAVQRGLLSERQAEELLAALSGDLPIGRPRRLSSLAVERDVMAQADADDVCRSILPTDTPARLGRYQVVEFIGRGGMGTVYRALDPMLERHVAVKTINESFTANEQYITRFQTEAAVAARLRSPHTVRVYDRGKEDRTEYIVMEFVNGENLGDVLDRVGKFEEKRACAICADVVQALIEAHEHQIVHRDVKPLNIVMEAGGLVKLADLGLAKRLQVLPSEDTSPFVTQPGQVLGTPAYMSPEQASGKELDHRSDICSLGATLYHLVCGQPPYHGHSDQEMIIMAATAAVPDAREVNPELSPFVAGVICRMMAKKPKDRYQDLEELRRDLQEGPRARVPLTPKRRPPKAVAATVVQQSTVETAGPTPAIREPWVGELRRILVLTPHGEEERDVALYTNSLGMPFVRVPEGQFAMGSHASERGRFEDEDMHSARVAQPFFLAIYPVTNAQYRLLKPRHNSGSFEGRSLNDDKRPVVHVSWHDAVAYCEWLSTRDAATYALPGEAEWEFACRALSTTRVYTGGRITTGQANFNNELVHRAGSSGVFRRQTTDVGSFLPNAFGLYDMLGNVWEWCRSMYRPYPYADDDGREEVYSHGPRVMRGGSWSDQVSDLRSALRVKGYPGSVGNNLGFRLRAENPQAVIP